jgi:predicted membrane channel-forming protein YqfA (hemolysin III family)
MGDVSHEIAKVQQPAAARSWVVGLWWALGAFGVMVAVILASAVVDPLTIWLLVLGVPAIVFVVATIVAALRRQAHGRR